MSFVPTPPTPALNQTFAALDLGTNNCRMLVARRTARGFKVVDAFSRITRLGEGLARSGRLSQQAMDRTVLALKACVEKMARNRVVRARLVATEACRRAENCAEFCARVADETGLALDIISAQEEASLALAGCAPLLDPAIPNALVFDIGGGSTELIWVSNRSGRPSIQGIQSIPVGVVTLAEQHAAALVSPEGYEAIVADLVLRLKPFENRHDIASHLAGGTVQMLGTSGTVTTLAAVHLDLDRYDRAMVDGVDLSFADISRISRRLAGMSSAERAGHPCIGPERADLVVAGCAILEAVCRLWPLEMLRVADRGVREGVLVGLMGLERTAEPTAPEGAS